MKILVIGMGHAGRRHARIARELGHTVYWTDQRPEATCEDGARVASIRMAELDVIRAAVVCTPPDQHYHSAATLLAHGIMTLVEKPLCQHYYQGRALCDLAEAIGVPLACGYQLRAMPSMQKFLAESGRGEFQAIYQSPPWPEATYERELIAEMSHELDIAGEILSGGLDTVKQHWHQRTALKFTLSGPPGRARFEFCIGPSEYRRQMAYRIRYGPKHEWTFTHDENEAAYVEQMRAFLAGTPYCSGHAALEALRLMELVREKIAEDVW